MSKLGDRLEIGSSKRTTRRGGVRSALVALTAIVALGACGYDSPDIDESGRNADGDITKGGKVGVLRLQVGDCIEELKRSRKGSSVSAVEGVPCDEPHAGEVFATFDLGGSTWPGLEAWPGLDPVRRQADEGCIDRFEDYVGVRFWESWFTFSTFHPTMEGWTSGEDRGVLRVGMLDGVQVSRSMQGIGAGSDREHVVDVGDCYTAGEAVKLSPEVPSDAPHDSEVFAVFELPSGAWPGVDRPRGPLRRAASSASPPTSASPTTTRSSRSSAARRTSSSGTAPAVGTRSALPICRASRCPIR